MLLLFDGGIFEVDVLVELVGRVVEQREGRRDGRVPADVDAVKARVVEQR